MTNKAEEGLLTLHAKFIVDTRIKITFLKRPRLDVSFPSLKDVARSGVLAYQRHRRHVPVLDREYLWQTDRARPYRSGRFKREDA